MKKDGIMPFVATWMDLEMIILSEACQTEKDSSLWLTILLVQQAGADYQVMGGAQRGECDD